jgi:hypothetical protein
MAAEGGLHASGASITIPGRVAPSDKIIIAGAYNLLRRQQEAGRRSGLRVVDSLDSRYRFQITNPRDVDTNALRSLELKLQRCRSVVLDLPRNRIIVECWRESHAGKTQGKKRGRRDLEDVAELPAYIESKFAPLVPAMESPVQVLREIMLWIINRVEDFCSFEFSVDHDDAAEVFRLRLQGFDSTTLEFVRALNDQWKTFVQNVVFEWGSKSLLLVVSK